MLYRRRYQIIIEGKEFKKYDDMYYVSKDGEVYSTFKKGMLKPGKDTRGYWRVDIHGKHMQIHKLVYLVWKGNIPEGMQVNHYNDVKTDNSVDNLYLGTQKENISDCVRNNHRVGHYVTLLVYDKFEDKILRFPSCKSFLDYCGHPMTNGSLAHCKNKIWFNERYEIIEQKSVTTRSELDEYMSCSE